MAGALALAALTMFGVRRSRRYAALASEPGHPLGQSRRDRDAAPVPTYRDDTGLIWHDLTPPGDASE